MTTPPRSTFVSLAATIAITLALGACVRAPVQDVQSVERGRIAVHFDNEAREHVHVYLIGATRQWLLGRVEPGAIASLAVPREALDDESGFLRLAVIAGERVTLQAARHARAKVTVAQPAVAMLSQRWKLSRGELTSMRR
jgi:hypothetical protein